MAVCNVTNYCTSLHSVIVLYFNLSRSHSRIFFCPLKFDHNPVVPARHSFPGSFIPVLIGAISKCANVRYNLPGQLSRAVPVKLSLQGRSSGHALDTPSIVAFQSLS